MSTFILKLIAIIAMLIDHIGATLVNSSVNPELYYVCRSIGRIAFPIFVFLIVEGFHHTHDIMKYMKRLAVFALISEIPYDIAFYQYQTGRNFIEDVKTIVANGFQQQQLASLVGNLNRQQNVFFTLFLGLSVIYIMSLVEKKFQKQIIITNLLDAAVTIIFCFFAYILKTDYDFAGVLLIITFYLFRGRKILLSISLFLINATILSNVTAFLETGYLLYVIQLLATFAMLPIALYNGKKGKDIKYFFYIFYPAHLLLLFFLQAWI